VKRWERWTFGVLALIVSLSGFAYFAMKYLMGTEDPFAVVNHPWQPVMLHVHVLASPPFVLMLGIILNSHILKKLRATKMANRKSGLTSLVTFALMVLSGYLLQVTSDEAWLRALVAVHVATGVVFSLAYGVHLVISVRIARSWVTMREVA
jgi:hypothetical protein